MQIRIFALVAALTFTAAMCGCDLASNGTRDAGGSPDGSTDAGDLAFIIASKVDKNSYQEALVKISVPRDPGSAGWQMVQDFGAQRFSELGYRVERQSFDGGVNVIGVKEGTAPDAGEVIISAHYDGVPDCPAADDNGSGAAGVLEAAKVLSGASFGKTLVVALWDHEERAGDSLDMQLGSKAYASRARERGQNIDVAFVFEMIGYKSDEPGSQEIPPGLDILYPSQARWLEDHGKVGDFVIVVDDEMAHKAMMEFKRRAAEFGVPAISLEVAEENTGNLLYLSLMRSDHAPFWFNGYPAMMITDSSEYRNKNYHCPGGLIDSVDRLDAGFATAIIKATVAAAVKSLGPGM